MGRDWHALLGRRFLHRVERANDPRGHDGIFHQSVGADDMNRLGVLLGRQGLEPHYLLVVDRREPAAQLIVCCEAAGGRDQHRAGLEHALHERLGLRAEVRVLRNGRIVRRALQDHEAIVAGPADGQDRALDLSE